MNMRLIKIMLVIQIKVDKFTIVETLIHNVDAWEEKLI